MLFSHFHSNGGLSLNVGACFFQGLELWNKERYKNLFLWSIPFSHIVLSYFYLIEFIEFIRVYIACKKYKMFGWYDTGIRITWFHLQDEFCYIDGACVRPMENSSTNECLICNATNDKYQWTENEGKSTTEI